MANQMIAELRLTKKFLNSFNIDVAAVVGACEVISEKLRFRVAQNSDPVTRSQKNRVRQNKRPTNSGLHVHFSLLHTTFLKWIIT